MDTDHICYLRKLQRLMENSSLMLMLQAHNNMFELIFEPKGMSTKLFMFSQLVNKSNKEPPQIY